MTSFIRICAAALLFGGAAQAGTIDFTDDEFAVVQVSLIASNPTVQSFTETADGVTFTFSSLRPATEFNRGLEFGLGGLRIGGIFPGTIGFTTSRDVIFDSYDAGIGATLGAPVLSVLATSVILSRDNPLSAGSGGPFNRGPIAISAGVNYAFDVPNSGFTTTLAKIASVDFTIAQDAVPNVPLPAGLPLMLAGLGALGIAKLRRG